MTALVRAIAAREVQRQYLALAHGRRRGDALQHRGADRPRSRKSRVRMAGRRAAASRRAPTSSALAASAAHCARALHPAHRPHAPDPRAPGVARPSAGRRRALRRRAGARPGAPGAACARAGASRTRARRAARLRAPSRRPTLPPRGEQCTSRRCEPRRVRYNAGNPGQPLPWRSRKRQAHPARSRRSPREPEREPRRRGHDAPRGRRTAHRESAPGTLQPLRPGLTAQASSRSNDRLACRRMRRSTVHDDHPDAKRVLETALICAQQPLPLREMRVLFDDELGADTLRALLDELAHDWAGRGVELVALASGWRFQSRPEMREYLDRLQPREAAEVLARRAGDAGHHRLPPAGDARRHRGHPRRRRQHARSSSSSRTAAGSRRSATARRRAGRRCIATTRQFLDDLGLALARPAADARRRRARPRARRPQRPSRLAAATATAQAELAWRRRAGRRDRRAPEPIPPTPPANAASEAPMERQA